MMTFFLSNTLESQLLSSGAFEIFYDGKFDLIVYHFILILLIYNLYLDVPIWSKLAAGRIPSAQELFTMIDNQSKFYGESNRFDDTMHTISGSGLKL